MECKPVSLINTSDEILYNQLLYWEVVIYVSREQAGWDAQWLTILQQQQLNLQK